MPERNPPGMSRPSFVNQITLGNVLQLLGVLVAVFVAWGNVQTRLASLEQRDQEMQRQFDAELVETRRVRPDVEARLRALETRFGAALVEVEGLKSDMTELKEALKETNGQLREVATLLRQANGKEK
jgi:uncharacterized protein HemX